MCKWFRHICLVMKYLSFFFVNKCHSYFPTHWVTIFYAHWPYLSQFFTVWLLTWLNIPIQEASGKLSQIRTCKEIFLGCFISSLVGLQASYQISGPIFSPILSVVIYDSLHNFLGLSLCHLSLSACLRMIRSSSFVND